MAFSCKGRALCPSCASRRTAERAAHLVDRVLPDVPMRQWVLSVPYRLRYRLAWDHDLCRVVAGILVRSVFRILRERARDAGVEHGRGGAVAEICFKGRPHGRKSRSSRWHFRGALQDGLANRFDRFRNGSSQA